jgi:hypothetical protein
MIELPGGVLGPVGKPWPAAPPYRLRRSLFYVWVTRRFFCFFAGRGKSESVADQQHRQPARSFLALVAGKTIRRRRFVPPGADQIERGVSQVRRTKHHVKSFDEHIEPHVGDRVEFELGADPRSGRTRAQNLTLI